MIKKILNGEYSLTTCFWKIYIPGTFIFALLTNIIHYVTSLILLITFTIIILIGIWNSSSNTITKSKQKKSIFFGYLARGWVILIIFFVIKGIIFNTDKYERMGLGITESFLTSIAAGATQDVLVFFNLYKEPPVYDPLERLRERLK